MQTSHAPLFHFVSIAVVATTLALPKAGAQTSFQEGVSPTVAYTHDATYIRSSAVDGNFNDDTDLELIVGTTMSEQADILRSLLEFDLSEIPASNQADAVSLVLTTHSNTGLDQGGEDGNPTFDVYSYGFDIDETAATWNAPADGDATAGGTLGTLLTSASFDVTATGQPITFGDTPAFRDAVDDALAGDGFLRLIVVKRDETTVGTHEFTRFAADSFATAADRPRLNIEHNPPLIAIDDVGATDEDTSLSGVDPGTTASLLANDTAITPMVSIADATSTSGATVTVNADGTFSYDPSTIPSVQALDAGDSLVDTFTYTLSNITSPPETTSTGTAGTVLGTGSGALLGGDLTDQDDVHSEAAYNPPGDFGGFDATFSGNDEAAFFGGEFAFNVFDNTVGGGNAKWCCNSAGPTTPDGAGLFVAAEFPSPYILTHFTITSSNDSPPRDPRVWAIEGSNDGSSWTPIFSYSNPAASPFGARNQVLLYTGSNGRTDLTGGASHFESGTAYTHFRYFVDSTGSAAQHALGELEFFGVAADTATVTVTVDGENDAPTVTTPILDVTMTTTAPSATVKLFPHFEDVDGDDLDPTLSYTVTVDNEVSSGVGSGPLVATATVDSADGCLELTTPCDLKGTIEVTVTAEDTGGETVSDTFVVTVVDDVAPVCPPLPKLFVTAPSGATSAVVTWPDVVMVDKVDGNITASCTPPSGSTFPWGATEITCTASDSASNPTTCTFLVAVKLPDDVVVPGLQAGASTDGNAAADAAPGVGMPFQVIKGAHLSRGGRLLLEAKASGLSGLWTGEPGAYDLLALESTTALPGTTGAVSAFDRYAIAANGDTSLRARIRGVTSDSNEGMWSAPSGGGAAEVGVLGSVAPGAGGATFTKFPLGAWAFTDDGQYYFLANVTGAGVTEANNQGLWSSGGGLLLREDAATSALAGVRHGKFSTTMGANAGGEIAFDSWLRGTGVDSSNNAAVFAGDPAALEPVVRRGDAAPGAPAGALFNRFSAVSNNDSGAVVFTSRLSGAVTATTNDGIWTGVPGSVEMVALEGAVAPGLGDPTIVFHEFTDVRINDNGQVLFMARLAGGTPAVTATDDDAIYAYTPRVGLEPIAAEGEVAPDTASVWTGISSFAAHDGGDLAINGSLERGVGGVTRKNDHGVWTVSAPGETPRLVVRGGDSFPDADDDGTDEVVHRPFVSAPGGGLAGRSSAVACGNVAVVVTYDSNRQTQVWVLGIPDGIPD